MQRTRTTQQYLASNLVFLRKKAGLSQDEIVAILGIKRSTYSAYENSRAEPFLDVLLLLSAYHGFAIDVLLGINLADLSEYDFHEIKARSLVYLQSLRQLKRAQRFKKNDTEQIQA